MQDISYENFRDSIWAIPSLDKSNIPIRKTYRPTQRDKFKNLQFFSYFHVTTKVIFFKLFSQWVGFHRMESEK